MSFRTHTDTRRDLKWNAGPANPTQAKSAFHRELPFSKEYVVCYAEMEHFRHIHVHVFAKPLNLPDELRGGGSFALLKVTPEEAVLPDKIIAFCELLRDKSVYTPQI